jgi:hypothetical protein
MKKILFLAMLAVGLNACNDTNQISKTETLQQKIGKAYGIENFSKLNKLSYTFNTKRGETVSSRSWVWHTKKNLIEFKSPAVNVVYQRDTIQSAEMKKIDGMFINDQYWLMYPFHITWDAGTTQSIKYNMTTPISKQSATMLTVQYGSVGGYTPGDAYDVYVNDQNMITEWSYRSKGVEKPSLTTTWAGVKDFSGVKLITDFSNEAKTFNLYFTNISAE